MDWHGGIYFEAQTHFAGMNLQYDDFEQRAEIAGTTDRDSFQAFPGLDQHGRASGVT